MIFQDGKFSRFAGTLIFNSNVCQVEREGISLSLSSSLFDVFPTNERAPLQHIKLVQSEEAEKDFHGENKEFFSLFYSKFNEVLKIKIEQTINFHESP